MEINFSMQGQNIIEIKNFAFIPPNMTVPNGSKVTWKDEDSLQHTVTSDSGIFDSGPLNPGQDYTFTFNNPGTYPYHCTLHPYMHGTITVV